MYLLLPFVAHDDQGLSIGELTCSGRCTSMSIHVDLCLSSVLFELLMCHGRTLSGKVRQTHTFVDILHSL